MRLVATDIHATYTVRGPFRLPFHSGGMFHGLFGRTLRKVACPEVPCCVKACVRAAATGGMPTADAVQAGSAGECDWKRLFSPPPRVPPPHRILAGQMEPPGPVVLLIPAPGGAALTAGQSVSLGLRLFGKAKKGDVDLLESSLKGIANMPFSGEEGRVELRAITRYSPVDVGAQLEKGLEAAGAAEGGSGAGVGSIQQTIVRFETPVRIKRGGEIAADIDFGTLFSQVWRRLTMLSALYGEYTEADDATFQRLRALAGDVRTVEKRLVPLAWEHLSAETGTLKPMRGLVGHGVFEGASLGELLPVLAAGEVVHIGGGTSFGLGRMKVEKAPVETPAKRRR